MKRALAFLVLLLAAAPGCVTLPFTQTPAPINDKPAPPPAPPVVLPEEITPENAHEKAAALAKELDYDAAGLPTDSSAPTAPKH